MVIDIGTPVSNLQLANLQLSDFQCAYMGGCMKNGVRLLISFQAHLYEQVVTLPVEANVHPVGASGAAGLEIAAEDDGRDAQPERAQLSFEIRLDAADDHVCQLGDGVQH